MAIEKIIPGDSQEALIKSAGRLIQVWEDRQHVKSAASPLYSQAELRELAPPKGNFLTHAITMGSSDLYGPNRNSDSWPHEELLRKHATFVTHGANYHEHRNTDKALACGVIKSAKYDPELQRGEIVFWTDIKKAAAQFEKARAGEEQHGSMAASVKSDLCNCCGFESKTASQRCSHIRDTPGAYVPSFQKYALMINVDPTFKDYSWVKRPADRIAHTLNYLCKAASVDGAAAERDLRGDELAEIYQHHQSSWLPWLNKIAEFDKLHHEHPAKQAAAQNILPKAWSGQLDSQLLEHMSNHPYPGRVMRSLLKRAMVLPLASFDAWISGRSLETSKQDPVVREASEKMAGIRAIIIHQLSTSPDTSGAFSEAANQFEPMTDACEDVVDQFMDKAREQFSTRYEALAKRASVNPAALQPAPSGLPASVEAYALAALYNAYLCKTASYLEDDWMLHAQMAFAR